MKIIVYERADNPEKNRIGVYKKHVRELREDSTGYYVLIRKMKAYIYYDRTKTAYIRSWVREL